MMPDENLPDEMAPITVSAATSTALMPRTFAEAMQLAEFVATSQFCPVSFYGKPGDIMLAIQWGAEIGLRPLQSLNSIMVVNGRPTIFGDAALALVLRSGLLVNMVEEITGDEMKPDWTAHCSLRRRDIESPFVGHFSYKDAQRGLLLSKQGPWQQYPRRMLQHRARAWPLRDGFADVLRGLSIYEEVQDFS